MRWGTNESGGPMRWGTNEMSGAWVLIGGSMRWGTNEMGDQWDGEPMRWGTNEMGDQWCAPIYATCIICVCSQNCGLLSTHDLLIIHMNECTCMEFLWHFFSGFKPDAKIMGPEPCQNQPDARNISTIPVLFWHIMACNYLLNFGHHRLVYISSAAADGSSPSPSSSWPPVKVALDISGGPIENQWGSGKYPG